YPKAAHSLRHNPRRTRRLHRRPTPMLYALAHTSARSEVEIPESASPRRLVDSRRLSFRISHYHGIRRVSLSASGVSCAAGAPAPPLDARHSAVPAHAVDKG